MSKKDISNVILALQKGSLVVYPTDTLYAIGANIYNEDAVRRVFQIKRRPFSNPLPVAVPSFELMKEIAYTNDSVKHLTKSFLPGALTLILKKKNCVSDIVTGGLNNIAVRIPANDIALELLSTFGPLTVTSANIHGEKTPGFINDIRTKFKDDDISAYIDAGRLEGKPSTIVDLTSKKPRIIREGILPADQILGVI
jgi:L-threonylcarbamoyladenylate synthase